MGTFGVVVFGLVGACIGSFLNVVIWRLPRGESLMHPGSHCPRCQRAIRWFDNLPVLSWLLLRGRCRGCRGTIAVRYPAVEALTALLFVLAALRYPDQPADAAASAALLAALVAITFIDIDHRIIPDAITKPGMALALILALLTTIHPGDWLGGGLKPGLCRVLHAGAGILTGLLVIWGVRLLGQLLFRKESMGLGDAKLLGLIGGFTGPWGVLYALIVACLGGSVVHGLVVLLTRKRAKTLTLEVRRSDAPPAEGPLRFSRAWVRQTPALSGGDGGGAIELEVESADPLTPGTNVSVRVVLPKVRVLMDEDVSWQGAAEVARSASGRLRLLPQGLSAEEVEHFTFFAGSHRYLPFGPYLALGGAVAALYAEWIGWLFTVAYPGWVSSLLR